MESFTDAEVQLMLDVVQNYWQGFTKEEPTELVESIVRKLSTETDTES